MGRNPKPTALKVLNGNPGKRPLNDKEPQPARSLPKSPYGMEYHAKKMWDDITPKLHRLGILTEIDHQMLELMCVHYGLARQAMTEIKKNGIISVGDRGNIIRNPALAVLNTNSQVFRRYATEFGLTPSSRAKLKVAEPDEDKDDYFGY